MANSSVTLQIWLSTGLAIILLVIGTLMLMVTPTDTASEFRPLIRPRQSQANDNEEAATTDEEVQTRIAGLFNRERFSNPDPEPEDYPEEDRYATEPRIDSSANSRPRRPTQKVGKDFDPTQSYVYKHPNGTITYVFPMKLVSSSNKSSAIDSSPVDVPENPSNDNNNVTYRTSSSNSRDFVFPNELVPKLDSDECRPEHPVCTDVKNYPVEKINDIISRNEHRFSEVFGNDLVVPDGDKLVTRFDTSDDEPLCMSEERLVHPTSGFNMEKNTVLIVNTPNYAQGVRIETCRTEGETCSDPSPGYTTVCKQVYHYRTLLAIDKNGQPYKESFRLPSCCKCVRRSDKTKLYGGNK